MIAMVIGMIAIYLFGNGIFVVVDTTITFGLLSYFASPFKTDSINGCQGKMSMPIHGVEFDYPCLSEMAH